MSQPANAPTQVIPDDPRACVEQSTDQMRRALAMRGDARVNALRYALRLNPYALKARYWLGLALLQTRQTAPARQVLSEVAKVAPEDHTPLKFYRATVAIIETKKGDLEDSEKLLQSVEKQIASHHALVLARLEHALRRKKNRPPTNEWLALLDRIPVVQLNARIIADKCCKFFAERDQIAEGDQVLEWLQKNWLAKYPNEPLLAVLPYLHHIKYWQFDRWVSELPEQVFNEDAGDLVCFFILEKIGEDENGNPVPGDKQLEILGALVKRLPGVSNLAYNYLAHLNTLAKKRLLTDGDAEGAAKLWRESFQLDPFNVPVQFNFALAQARQGKTHRYYIQWHQALRLACWRWELSGDRSDWDLCVARVLVTANKLREEIENAQRENQDVAPVKIAAWLKYLDVYAMLKQMTFEHPYHRLGLHADAPADEARRISQQWQAILAQWDVLNHLAPPKNVGAHPPAELITFIANRISTALTTARNAPSNAELDAFREYCKQRAQHARDVFFVLANLVGENRFVEARGMIGRLNRMPLVTLEPYLKEIKVRGDEGDIPLSNLINEKELTERTISYVGRYADFLAEEGDDPELIRQIGQIGNLPWAKVDKPDEARRKLRERMAFAVVGGATFKAINDDRWAEAIPATEATLSRLPNQLDLLWLAALTVFRSLADVFDDPDSATIRWAEVRAKLQKADGYIQRAKQIASDDEFTARMTDLPEAIASRLKFATEMETPRGQAVRRARPLLDQEEWSKAYQILSQIPSKDRNAEIEFYLGLCMFRQAEGMLGKGKQRPPLNELKSKYDKAAAHLRAARQFPAESDLNKAIDNVLKNAEEMIAQINRAQIKEAAEEFMKQERWDEAYNKLSSLSKPDADTLFYMALCRFRGSIKEFNTTTSPSQSDIRRAQNRLDEALKHIRDAKKTATEDDLNKVLDNLEDQVRKNLNVLKTM